MLMGATPFAVFLFSSASSSVLQNSSFVAAPAFSGRFWELTTNVFWSFFTITAFLLYDDKAGLTTGPNYYVGYYESMAPVASMRKLCVLPNALSLGSTANCTDFY